jgi:hypothetical protein
VTSFHSLNFKNLQDVETTDQNVMGQLLMIKKTESEGASSTGRADETNAHVMKKPILKGIKHSSL